jgi:hypothetical protein
MGVGFGKMVIEIIRMYALPYKISVKRCLNSSIGG